VVWDLQVSQVDERNAIYEENWDMDLDKHRLYSYYYYKIFTFHITHIRQRLKSTFWITLQPYIWRLKGKTWPTSLVPRSLLCSRVPCSKNCSDYMLFLLIQTQVYWLLVTRHEYVRRIKIPRTRRFILNNSIPFGSHSSQKRQSLMMQHEEELLQKQMPSLRQCSFPTSAGWIGYHVGQRWDQEYIQN
jgi:hypothetical protein